VSLSSGSSSPIFNAAHPKRQPNISRGLQSSAMHKTLIFDKSVNSKFVIFKEKLLKVLKCYNILWVQRRHNCSPAATFVNSVMTIYLLKVHLQTFLSIPITEKCLILSCETLVANERYEVRKCKKNHV